MEVNPQIQSQNLDLELFKLKHNINNILAKAYEVHDKFDGLASKDYVDESISNIDMPDMDDYLKANQVYKQGNEGYNIEIGKGKTSTSASLYNSSVYISGDYVAGAENDYNNVVIGPNSKCKLNDNVVLGFGAFADNAYNTVVGTNAKGLSATGVAVGTNSKSGNQYAIAIGTNTYATGVGSVGIGYQAMTSGTGAICIGQEAVAGTQESIVIGTNSKVAGTKSIIIGSQLATNSSTNNVVIIGGSNITSITLGPIVISWDENDLIITKGGTQKINIHWTTI